MMHTTSPQHLRSRISPRTGQLSDSSTIAPEQQRLHTRATESTQIDQLLVNLPEEAKHKHLTYKRTLLPNMRERQREETL